MSIRKESSGRRFIQVEVEVPGTPEEVWQAIATGPGVSSWFVPTRMENGEGGIPTSMVLTFAPGMDSVAAVTAWQPPHRFAAESDGLGPDAPPMATEWSVEAKTGGVCVVRVVHSLFASTDDWDDQLEGMESGWPAIFMILKQYLSQFKGQACSTFSPMAFTAGSVSSLWNRLLAPLGLENAAPGQEWRSAAGVPRLSGKVEREAAIIRTCSSTSTGQLPEPCSSTPAPWANRACYQSTSISTGTPRRAPCHATSRCGRPG